MKNNKNNGNKKNSNPPTGTKLIQRLFIVTAASALAAVAITGIFNLIGFKEPVDKLIVVVSAIGIVLYTAHDIKTKLTSWKI